MGPRKQLAVRKKRGVGESSGERRSKRKEDSQAPQAPVQPQQPLISMQNRPVTTGRRLYFDFLDNEQFRIGNWLRAQGWVKFCTLEEPIYPRLIRMFFENMSINSTSVCSTVKDVLIVLTEQSLSELLEMPSEGKCFLTLQNKLDGLKVILENDETTDLRNLQANRLSVEMRLLHHIVSRIFFPKTGRFDWVTEKDIAFVYYLVNNEKMNLPFMMINQIKEAAKKQKACLPYGMVFTLIFRHFGVDCSGEVVKTLLHTDRYTERSLHRMGYQKIEGRWSKKNSGQPTARDTSEEVAADEDDEEEESVPQDAQDDTLRTPPPHSAGTSARDTQPSGHSTEQLSQLVQGLTDRIVETLQTGFADVIGEMKRMHRDCLAETQIIFDHHQNFASVMREFLDRTVPPSPPASSSAIAISSHPVDRPARPPRPDPRPSRTYSRTARRPPPPPAGPAARTRSQSSRPSGSKEGSADS